MPTKEQMAKLRNSSFEQHTRTQETTDGIAVRGAGKYPPYRKPLQKPPKEGDTVLTYAYDHENNKGLKIVSVRTHHETKNPPS